MNPTGEPSRPNDQIAALNVARGAAHAPAYRLTEQAHLTRARFRQVYGVLYLLMAIGAAVTAIAFFGHHHSVGIKGLGVIVVLLALRLLLGRVAAIAWNRRQKRITRIIEG